MNLSQIKSDALAGTPADPPTTIALVEEVERLRSENAILCLVLKNALEDGIDLEFEEWGKEARQALGADQ
ncbi:hypothetical protein [Ponticaulis sp.]|uniref:hypothetical protein n=1 Tax=Ponticaulis sp. TaxID=2020902 RepID=UPI000C46E704|nr:hypothetical protein [Ponticaulis sp.]MBN04488.1 hypothetical protein [Ponticaulis sp.]|tara:strand:- start:534 stop:743 length:210 start_codon:yes stop_codon:yes gene_type:complete